MNRRVHYKIGQMSVEDYAADFKRDSLSGGLWFSSPVITRLWKGIDPQSMRIPWCWPLLVGIKMLAALTSWWRVPTVSYNCYEL